MTSTYLNPRMRSLAKLSIWCIYPEDDEFYRISPVSTQNNNHCIYNAIYVIIYVCILHAGNIIL